MSSLPAVGHIPLEAGSMPGGLSAARMAVWSAPPLTVSASDLTTPCRISYPVPCHCMAGSLLIPAHSPTEIIRASIGSWRDTGIAKLPEMLWSWAAMPERKNIGRKSQGEQQENEHKGRFCGKRWQSSG